MAQPESELEVRAQADLIRGEDIGLPETQTDCRIGDQRLGLQKSRGRADRHEIRALIKAVGREATVWGRDIYAPTEVSDGAKATIHLTVQLRSAKVRATDQSMSTGVINRSIGYLKCVVHAALRKIEDIRADRTEARNNHLADCVRIRFRIKGACLIDRLRVFWESGVREFPGIEQKWNAPQPWRSQERITRLVKIELRASIRKAQFVRNLRAELTGAE